MDPQRQVKISKYLSKHLRHQPERLKVTLQPGGWVDVEELLARCAANHFPISFEELQEVVACSDKQRFAFDETGTRIRANQGHSTPVDLQLVPSPPPPVLYHGTAAANLSSILASGLNRMARHHVHLSASAKTAVQVGRRHGRPVVLLVDAAAMEQAGFLFYRSANGVWLTGRVPAMFLRLLECSADEST